MLKLDSMVFDKISNCYGSLEPTEIERFLDEERNIKEIINESE